MLEANLSLIAPPQPSGEPPVLNGPFQRRVTVIIKCNILVASFACITSRDKVYSQVVYLPSQYTGSIAIFPRRKTSHETKTLMSSVKCTIQGAHNLQL